MEKKYKALSSTRADWEYSFSLSKLRIKPGLGACWLLQDSTDTASDEIAPKELWAIFSEIQKAIDAKLYYLAIAVALSVPDICACLECDPEKPIWATGDKYKAWCEANLTFRYENLTAEDLYRLRGGVLHHGHFGHPKSRYDRIIFLAPHSPIKAHDVIINVQNLSFGEVNAEDLCVSGRLLHLGFAEFCNDVVNAACAWAAESKENSNVTRNLPNLVRYRPEGLPQFSVGVPTIA